MSTGMILEKIKSDGLAHLSYIIGHQGRAAVIDPRRDCSIYVEMAYQKGMRIEYIFETHRNEDYVVGSRDLSRMTGARIYHGRHLDFHYGHSAAQGDIFELGDLRLKILETPGHTLESLSIAVTDSRSGDDAVAVFTGDALFVGDVGRTDFFPDRAQEVAGMLYDALFDKILPLGDQAILLPAHGAGSVCGENMADREFSTLGIERRTNPMLGKTNREEFIAAKLAEKHDQPPYFRRMEIYNQEGTAPSISALSLPKALSPDIFEAEVKQGAQILDVRSPEAIGGALIPKSIGIPLDMIPAFAGWFLKHDQKIILVVNGYEEAKTAYQHLLRIGYDRITGFLDEGLHAWEISGRTYQTIPAVSTFEVVNWINDKKDFMLLDVRKAKEFEAGRLPDATHVYLGDLPDNLDMIPRNKPVVTFCGSGLRAVIAATLLKQAQVVNVHCCLGSMAACAAAGCPVVQGNG